VTQGMELGSMPIVNSEQAKNNLQCETFNPSRSSV